jgi:DNA-binding NtrC family response regulator
VEITGRTASTALRGLSLLVVEDDFLLLSELEAVLREAGAEVVYPCRNVADAAATVDSRALEAAVLDVRIGHNSITPVARKLAQLGTPFLFYTGQIGGDRTMLEWPDRLVISKPASFQKLVHAVAGLLAHKPVLSRSV